MSDRKYTKPQIFNRGAFKIDRMKHSDEYSANVGKLLLKTKVCSLFLNGRCHYGADRCFYAHSVDELREQPHLEKTSLCPAFKRGRCGREENCTYAHSIEEMTSSAKRVMCLWYNEGYCSHGSACRFSHGDISAASYLETRKTISHPSWDNIHQKRRTESNVSSQAMSPSLTPTIKSPLQAGGFEKEISLDEFDCAASMQSHTSTGLSILEFLASTPNSAPTIDDSKISQLTNACDTCMSADVCICRVFEECSELLRLL